MRAERFQTLVDQRFEACVDLAAQLIRMPTENPPGNTANATDLLVSHLVGASVVVQRFEPAPGCNGLVARLPSGRPGPHLVYCAHLDVFPIGDPSAWSFDPFSGAVHEGRLLGRGASDMKGALAASLTAFLAMRDAGLPRVGSASLLLVSDEETGGRWGTDWALDQFPDLVADACVIGEPSGTDVYRIGEKGQLWVRLEARGEGYHGGLADGSEPSWRMVRALEAVRALTGEELPVLPEHAELVATSQAFAWTPQSKGREWLFTAISANLGVLSGGLKVNMSPASCAAEIDFRLPLGVDPNALFQDVCRIVAPFGVEAHPLLAHPCPATVTHIEAPVVRAAANHASRVVGRPVPAVMAPTYTDARFFRGRGVPAVVYGPRPYNMGAPDEWITLDDLRRTLQVHAGIGWDLLAGETAAW